MNTYMTPLGEPTRSAFGPLARRGSRTSTHSAVRVTQLADSKRAGKRSSEDALSAPAARAAPAAAPGGVTPTMRVPATRASAADCGVIGAPDPAGPTPNAPCGADGKK